METSRAIFGVGWFLFLVANLSFAHFTQKSNLQTPRMRRLWNKGVFILTNCGVIHNAYKFRVGFAAALFVFLTSLRHLNILPNKFFYLAQYMAPALYVNFVVELYGKDRATISHALLVVTFCVPCIMCFFRKIESLPYLGAVTILLGMYGFVLFPEIHPGVVMCATAYPLLWCIEIVHERRSRVSLKCSPVCGYRFHENNHSRKWLDYYRGERGFVFRDGLLKTEMVHKMRFQHIWQFCKRDARSASNGICTSVQERIMTKVKMARRRIVFC